MPADFDASEQHEQSGWLMLYRHADEDAIECFRAAIAANPQNDSAHASLAQALFRLGQISAALEALDMAISLRPDFGSHHAYKALLLSEVHDLKGEESSLRKALGLSPSSPYVHRCAALIAMENEEWGTAEEHIRNSIRLNPRNVEYLHILVDLLLLDDRDEEAGEVLTQAVQMEPENAETHSQLGWTLLHVSPQQAEKHFHEALRLNPTHNGARLGMLEAFKRKSWLYRLFQTPQEWAEKNLSKRGVYLLGVIAALLAVLTCMGTYLYIESPEVSFIATSYILLALFTMVFFLVAIWSFLGNAVSHFLLVIDPRARLALSKDERNEAIKTTVFTAIIILLVLIGATLQLTLT